MHLEKALK